MYSNGFGRAFLQDSETKMGDVPSVEKWLIEHTFLADADDVILTRRIRLTVELLD
jgi:hypothetical protein